MAGRLTAKTSAIILNISVSTAADTWIQFKVNTTTLWSKIFNAYATHSKRDISGLTFYDQTKQHQLDVSTYPTVGDAINANVINYNDKEIYINYSDDKEILNRDQNDPWQSKLIDSNPTMKLDRSAVFYTVNYWFRNFLNNNCILPQCVETICIEYYVLAKCGSCGQIATNDGNKQLFLNLYDGFIGCSRHHNKCSLKNWEKNYKDKSNVLSSSLVVCLSSMDKYGADVWNYSQNIYWADRHTMGDDKKMLPELRKYLMCLHVDMNEYKWSITRNISQKKSKKLLLRCEPETAAFRHMGVSFKVNPTTSWSKIFAVYGKIFAAVELNGPAIELNQNGPFDFICNGNRVNGNQIVEEIININEVDDKEEIKVVVVHDPQSG